MALSSVPSASVMAGFAGYLIRWGATSNYGPRLVFEVYVLLGLGALIAAAGLYLAGRRLAGEDAPVLRRASRLLAVALVIGGGVLWWVTESLRAGS